MSDTLLIEDTDTTTEITDDGDHDRFAHYFRKNDLTKAYFDGQKIKALCGKKDIPTRDFTKFPVCPTCKEIYETLKP
jgi:hypothetical protein